MLPRRVRGFQAPNAPEKTRTHLLFSAAADRSIAKRKRRPHNKFHQVQQHKRDENVQVGGTGSGQEELDPSQWTGNQRIIHFGPMAQRDPFFYFYPKGWDLLYPAQFGFFPYRTNKFRGSSAVVCVWAFGLFLLLGGALMVYLGYFVVHQSPFWRWSDEERQHMIPPIQITGPLLVMFGLSLIVLGIFCSISTSQFLSEKLRHHHHQDQPAQVTIYTTHYQQPRAVYEVSPYQPLPPLAHPVVENPYARTHLLDYSKEMKLFPPVMHGYSTLSLHAQTSTTAFVASPYNTLRAISLQRSPSIGNVVAGEFCSASANHQPPLHQTASSHQRHHSPSNKRKRTSSSVHSVASAQEKWGRQQQHRRKSSSVDEPWTTTQQRSRHPSSTGSSGGERIGKQYR